jgi:hypothetical protein
VRLSDEQLPRQLRPLAKCSRHILVKLDGNNGAPLAVGSFANGEWQDIRYANNQDARGGGSRACGRGSAAALPPANAEEILGQFDAFLPALQAFQLEVATNQAQGGLVLREARPQPGTAGQHHLT